MLFKKKEFETSGSLSKLAWKKFKRNRLSFGALCLIIVSILIGILGYLITPDNTPYANDQHLELAAKKPGFNVEMLLVKKNVSVGKQNIFSKMFFGQKSEFTSIPIDSYEFAGDEIIVSEYSGEGNAIIKKEYKLPDVLFSLKLESLKVYKNTLSFQLIGGQEKSGTIKEFQKEIVKNNIVDKHFLLGTDKFGRDVLSQIIIGARISLSVGFIAVLLSLLIGISLGSLAGFFRGWVDNVIVWFINVVWSIPTLLMVIAITFALGKGFWQVFVAVGLTMWVEIARVVRGQILSIREKEFVEAGKALGFTNFRIISRHILPNITGPLIVISAANFAAAILIEAGLSFLGIGVQPPMPSWGTMIKENYAYIILDAAHLAILPGLAIMLMVMAFMLVGNGLRDALDVRMKN